MKTQWFLVRGKGPGQAKAKPTGPLSAEKLLELASSGEAAKDDWVRPEGVDVQIPVERFVAMMRSGKLPDWLNDVTRTEAVRLPGPATPDWLDDVTKQEAPPSDQPGAVDWLDDVIELEKIPRTLADMPVEWLDDIRQIEESLHIRPVVAGTKAEGVRPTKAEATRPTKVKDIHPTKALPVIPAPSAPPNLHAEPSPSGLSPLAPPASPAPSAPQSLHAEPLPPLPPPLPAPVAPLGFDPVTGQIIDPAAYRNWQKAEAQRRQDELQNQPTLSVAEVFLEAQRALQEWVDAEANKSLVAAGATAVIQNIPSVQDILRRYENYGPVMREKLLKRLAFLVDNRQKFMRAFGTAV